MKLDDLKPPKPALFWAIAMAATLFVATGYSIVPPPPHDISLSAALPSEPTAAVPHPVEAPQRLSDDVPEPDPSANAIGLTP
jgi:hypothetical protein